MRAGELYTRLGREHVCRGIIYEAGQRVIILYGAGQRVRVQVVGREHVCRGIM